LSRFVAEIDRERVRERNLGKDWDWDWERRSHRRAAVVDASSSEILVE